MPRKNYTPEQRADVVEMVRTSGIADTARQAGIPLGTVASWAHRAGVTAPETPSVSKAARASAVASIATAAERKAQLASDLLDDAQRLRRQLFAPCVERKVVVVSDGATHGSHVEVADIRHDHPPFADQRQIITSIAIAVDKIQILTGEATQRIEQLTAGTEPAERRQRATGVVDELAARRAG